MKFKLLAIGQKFRYQGEVYVKTSPLIASNVETSHNRMIPAYATLELLENTVVEKEIQQQEKLDTQQVLDAFNQFYATCVTLVEDTRQLEVARDQFLQSLGEK